MSLRHFLAYLAALLLTAGSGVSHEFWIEPVEYQVEKSSPLVADLRNGEEFRGSKLAYFEKRTARFELVQNDQARPVVPRLGDIPALDTFVEQDGLVVIIHETAPSTLKYTKWEKFLAFAKHKDFPDIVARHSDRGLPETGFVETYRRFAKALVGVGLGDGRDRPSGMETEFVALSNPFTDDLSEGFLVDLYYQGALRADAQVEVFEKSPDGTVAITLFRTDHNGRVRIPVIAGHDYLLDAVVLRPAPDDVPEVWETLWAAMTFSVPD